MTNVPVSTNRVKLNSNEYVTLGKRFETTLSSPGLFTKRYDRWDGGVGLKRETPRMRPGMSEDSTCETGYDGQITPPLLIQTATLAGTPTQTARIFAVGEIGGVLNCFAAGDNAGTKDIVRFEWDGATETWTRTAIGADVIVANEVSSNVGFIAGNLVVGYRADEATDRPAYLYTTTGTSYTARVDTTLANLTPQWFSNFGTSATGYALLDDRGLYSFTLGADFTLVLAAVYPSTETVKAFFSWTNGASTPANVLYLLTNKALRQSNTTPNAFAIFDSFPGADANCALPLGDDLYIGRGSYGGITRYRFMAYGSPPVQSEVGLDEFDGLASVRRGPVTALWYAGGWLFAQVSGDATGLFTSIYKRRLADGSPWHHVFKAATANQSAAVFAVSSADDSVARLHVALEASSTTDALYFVNYPLENPVNNTSVEYENGGTHVFPTMTFDYPGAFYKAVIVADGLVDAAETVTLKYALDGGSYVTTSLANSGVFNATNKSLLVASGAGVGFTSRIQFEIIFARGGTATNAVKVKELQIFMRIKKPVLLSRRFLFDANASKDTAKLKDGETVLSTLQALQGNAIQYTLVLQLQGSNTGTKYVSVEEVKMRGEAPFEFVAEKHLSGDFIEVTTTELVSVS